jgi:hypothetical protein
MGMIGGVSAHGAGITPCKTGMDGLDVFDEISGAWPAPQPQRH